MKHINISFVLFAILFSCAFTSAFGQGSKLSVMTEDGEYFNLKLDGRMMNSEPHQTMLFEGLAPGFYRLQTEVVTPEQEIVELKKSVNMEAGQHYKFNIKKNRRDEYVMRIFAIQPIANQPGQNMPPPPSAGQQSQMSPGFDPGEHPGNQPNTQWDDMGSTTINGATVRMSFMDFAGTGMSVEAGPGGASMSVSDGQGGHMSVGASGSHTDHASGGMPPDQDTAQVETCPQPMPKNAFQQELAVVQQLRNVQTVRAQIERLMREHCMTSMQIKQLIEELDNHQFRMEVSKTGWHHVYDPENYHFVFDAMLYPKDIASVKRYMEDNPLGDVHDEHHQVNPAPEPAPAPPPAQSFVSGYNGPIGCPGPVMSSGQFQQALSTIKNKSFADEQKTVARQILRNNCITVDQLKQLLQVFSFEDDKLDMAKFAYDSTHDIGNYYLLNDVFTFSSSTEELEQFLNGR